MAGPSNTDEQNARIKALERQIKRHQSTVQRLQAANAELQQQLERERGQRRKIP